MKISLLMLKRNLELMQTSIRTKHLSNHWL